MRLLGEWMAFESGALQRRSFTPKGHDTDMNEDNRDQENLPDTRTTEGGESSAAAGESLRASVTDEGTAEAAEAAGEPSAVDPGRPAGAVPEDPTPPAPTPPETPASGQGSQAAPPAGKPKFDLEAIKARVAAQKAAGEMPQSARAEPDSEAKPPAEGPAPATEEADKPKPKIDLEAIKARVAAQKAAGEMPQSARAAEGEAPPAEAADGEKPKPKIDLEAIKARTAAARAAKEAGEEGAPAAEKPAAPPRPARPEPPPPPSLSEEQEAEAKRFSDKLGDAILDKGLTGSYLRLTVAPERIVDVIRFAKEEREYNYFSEFTAADFMAENQIRVAYVLANVPQVSRTIVIHAVLSREDPHIDTITPLFQGADWSEREVYDLYGVMFDGHPDLRRIMLPDEWEGHPLRKDYTFID